MKSKKAFADFQDNDAFKGRKKHKLAPVKKQKSQKTQFFDEIEDEELDYKADDPDDFYDDDLDDFIDEEDDEDDDY